MGKEEGAIQSQITEYLKLRGIWHMRVQSGKVKVRGGWMQLAPTGTADLLAWPRSGPVWIEVKKPKGTHETEQQEFRDLMADLNVRYILARSLDEVIEGLR
jgi:hypothetical protein